jgi:hypothetical protein
MKIEAGRLSLPPLLCAAVPLAHHYLSTSLSTTRRFRNGFQTQIEVAEQVVPRGGECGGDLAQTLDETFKI